MKMRLTGFLIFILLSSLQSFAQESDWHHNSSHSSTTPKTQILYDPVFWKTQLKLTTEQQRKIDKINADFYENIKVAYTQKESSHADQIAQLLMNRSEQIWGTFHYRQKRRWEKLDSINVLHADSQRTQSAF